VDTRIGLKRLTLEFDGSSITDKSETTIGRQGSCMAEKGKCAHGVCDCKVEGDDKYCSEYCKNAEKSGVLEIGCGCEHAPCR